MSDQSQLQAIWQAVQQDLHKGEINRSLWDAAAAATPLTLDGDAFVLGFRPGEMRHGSYLTSTANWARVPGGRGAGGGGVPPAR